MVTAALQYYVFNALRLTIDVRNICVFLAPLFSSFTTIMTYLLTAEVMVPFHLIYLSDLFPSIYWHNPGRYRFIINHITPEWKNLFTHCFHTLLCDSLSTLLRKNRSDDRGEGLSHLIVGF